MRLDGRSCGTWVGICALHRVVQCALSRCRLACRCAGGKRSAVAEQRIGERVFRRVAHRVWLCSRRCRRWCRCCFCLASQLTPVEKQIGETIMSMIFAGRGCVAHHVLSSHVVEQGVVDMQPREPILSQHIHRVVTARSVSTVVVDDTKQAVPWPRLRAHRGAEHIGGNLERASVGKRLLTLLYASNLVVDESLEVKNKDRRKRLDKDLLGSIHLGRARRRPHSWDGLGLGEMEKRIFNRLYVCRLDVELQRLIRLECDAVLGTRSLEDAAKFATKDACDG